jgi:hypothetical protein
MQQWHISEVCSSGIYHRLKQWYISKAYSSGIYQRCAAVVYIRSAAVAYIRSAALYISEVCSIGV